MKHFALSILLFVTQISYAYLPVNAVTTMSLPVHGIYMTSDATCTTGLVATVPLSLTAQTINFASNPTIGSGAVPATIGCVIIVIDNKLSAGWAAGTYSTSSNGNPDSVCNSGGTTGNQQICNNGTTTWPAQITTDAAAIGLTLFTSNCTGATTSSIVPLVLSTNSACTGQHAADSLVTACSGGNVNNYAMPTSVGDVSNGTKLTAPSTAGNFVFVVDPANAFGNSGSSCGNTDAPLFSFRAQ